MNDFNPITCQSCDWRGTDDFADRVCECCGADEPKDDPGGICPACKRDTWWLPKCPACGSGCEWDESDRRDI